jgi:hypothetical protein|nr:hypothetical protein [uncultured Lachnoclostridium sp.]
MKTIQKKILSFLMILVILIGVVPTQTVEASDANYMSSQMINFFRSSNSIEDVRSLTADEIRVYAVFITNFMKPGQFTIEDLKGDVNSEFVQQVGKLFGSTPGNDDLSTIVKLNSIVYESIVTDIDSNDKCTLYASEDSNQALTGKELLNKMYFYDDKSTDVNELTKTNIYFGPEKAVSMDLSKPAIRGAFKILASYSVEYLLGEHGIANMSALYIDGYGNIWGSFVESLAIEERTVTTVTPTPKLKLVMPACLNPLSFTSFASSKPTQDDLKLPLNNAFAMGAFVKTGAVNNDFTKNITPYYNLYSYLAQDDMKNLLNIFGISSPLNSIGNSNSAHQNDLNFSSKLTSFFNNKLNTLYDDSTYIMLANNIKNVNSTLEKLTQEIKGVDGKRRVVKYLYDSMVISLDDVADTLYYFDSGSNESWSNTDFADLGLMGASLFTNDGDTFYGVNAKVNGITSKLSDFYTKLEEENISLSSIDGKDLSYSNIESIVRASELMGEVFGLNSTVAPKNVVVTPKMSTYLLPTVISLMGGTFTESKYNEVIESKTYKDAKKYYENTIITQHPNDTSVFARVYDSITVYDISQTISAVLYLAGVTNGECADYSDAQDFKSPSLFHVGNIAKDNDGDKKSRTPIKEVPYLYGLEDADTDSYTKVESTKGSWFMGIGSVSSTYIYSLGHYDGAASEVVTEEGWSGEFTTPNGPNQFFTNFNLYTLFSSHNINLSTSLANKEVIGKVGDKEVVYKVNNFIADGTNNWPGIFFGYMVDILQMDIASQKATEKAADGKTKYDCYSFESEYLPTATINVTGGKLDMSILSSESGVSTSDEQTMKEMQEDLVKKIYGIVSVGSNDYRNQWLKSTIDGILLTIHRNITGSWLSNMYTISAGSGSTYQGVVGYIHTPSLNDLPFTSWFMGNYMQIYALMLLLILISLILMVLLRIRTWRQGSAIFMLMCVALLLPNILLNNTINITNKVTDSIYSDKFDFWAMTQHYQSLEGLSKVRNSKEEIIASTFKQAEELYSSDAGVRIKWMSPKKSSVFESLYNNTDMSESFAANLTIFKWLFSSFIYESDFVGNDPLATYVYRSYNSIARAGLEYYELGIQSILKETPAGTPGTDGSDSKIPNAKKIEFINKDNKKVKTSVQPYKYVYDVYEKAKVSERSTEYPKMFYAAMIDKSLYTNKDNFTNIYYGSDSSKGKQKDIDSVDTLNINAASDSIALWGMGSEEINKVMFTKAEVFSPASTKRIGVESTLENSIESNMNMSDANTTAFLLNTEGPYYYFYNTLKYRYGSNNDFKSSLLDINIFKVRDVSFAASSSSANGSVRDFLDLEGLFTYLIPYLSVCNDYVYDWTNLNGTNVEGYNFEGTNAKNDINSENYIYGQSLKREMQKVWNMYSPWVDQLNSLSIHNKKVSVGTKTLRIENTLNPSYYLIAGRPMLFSEADMVAKGYRASDLTDIEIRLQRVLEETYTDMMYLVNYYDMDNEVLLSAAAMYATFNFNKEFSQNNLLGEPVTLYPQNFEMKNFNHDAFLRLALLNSTGETIFSSTDLFETVLSKTSIFTGILLLIEDVLAIIVIPTLKLILLLMLLFLGLLICLTCAIRPPDKIIQLLTKSFVLPTMLFMVSTIVFSWLVSMLVGDGLTSYVGSQNMSIATNDPTITILLLIVMNVIYVFVMFKIVKMLFESCKSHLPICVQSIVGLAQDGVKKVGRKAGNIVKGGVAGALPNFLNPLGIAGGAAIGGLDGATDGKISGSASKALLQGKNVTKGLYKGKSNVKNDIDTKASSYTNPITTHRVEPVTSEMSIIPKTQKELPPKVDSTVLGRVLSVPLKVSTGLVGGAKITGQALQSGVHKVDVGARVGAHYTKEGFRIIGEGTVAGVKIAGKAVGKAYDYAEERGLGGIALDGAKLAGKGALEAGKFATKPVVAAAKETGRYAYKSAKDAVALNKDMNDKLNTTYNNLYKHNHGYDLDIADKAAGKTGTTQEQEKAQKIKRNFDNKNQDRADREAWEIINRLESKRKENQ